jgi:glycogen debranching enzyme
MAYHKKTTQAVNKQQRDLSPAETQTRKQRVLTQGTSSITRGISDAVVVKNENAFFLSKPDGDVPLAGSHGFGLYYHDCRYLNGYELRLADAELNVLVSDAEQGFAAVFEMTNPELQIGEGEHIEKDSIGLRWDRVIDGNRHTLIDLLTLQNYGPKPIEFPIALAFQAEFEDVFAIRGLLPRQPGSLHPPEWKSGTLRFSYSGADHVERALNIQFDPPPSETDGTTAHFHIALESRASRKIRVVLSITETSEPQRTHSHSDQPADLHRVKQSLRDVAGDWLKDQTSVHTDSLLINDLLERSFRDLRMLRMHSGQEEFFAAGIPWYVALFGRDALITALQMLAFRPEIAAETLRLLAHYQGAEVNDWRDEEPGKILHELRVGELAKLNEIPHTPYYGTVDATPLFLILMGRHAAWTGNLSLFKELRGNVERALTWIDQYGDAEGDGYVEYESASGRNLVNQGWKDSGDAIVNEDGSLARPPIALVEVQGYVYLAKTLMADLYQRVGEPDRAKQLQQQADELRKRFNRDFWLEDKGCYALALQSGKEPVTVIASNPGHALWAGIADADKARRTIERLMADDMFSGWGIRTLSTQEQRYNPISYHLGTIWPHDSALIAAGFRRYGDDNAARRVFTGLIQAALKFKHYRLPELFAGFSNKEYSVPVDYPVACHPQAWAAGSVPHLIETFLGLRLEGFEHRLRIARPLLPDYVDRIEVRNMKVGEASVSLRFERTSDNTTAVNVLRKQGRLDVIVEANEKSGTQGPA